MKFFVQFLLCFLSFSVCNTRFIKRENCHCEDFYGSCRRDSEQWIDDGTWNYVCTRNVTSFVGCSSSTRGKSRMIPSGSVKVIDSFTFKCQETDTTLRYEEESRCTVNGSDLHIGDSFQQGYFQRRCLESGVWISGCYIKDKEDQTFLGVGESKQVGRVIHHCSIATDYPGRIQYWTSINENSTAQTASSGTKSKVDMLNFLSSPPTPWVIQYAEKFIKSNAEPRIKIRFLVPSKWT